MKTPRLSTANLSSLLLSLPSRLLSPSLLIVGVEKVASLGLPLLVLGGGGYTVKNVARWCSQGMNSYFKMPNGPFQMLDVRDFSFDRHRII